MKSANLLLLCAVLSLAAFACAQDQASPSTDNVQVIQVTARKYVFDPSPIHVKKGAHVQLKITATDHAHGFEIELYAEHVAKSGDPGLQFAAPQKCFKIEKGQTVTVEFVAQVEGTYHFKCCTDCGIHHRSMKGDLIVDP